MVNVVQNEPRAQAQRKKKKKKKKRTPICHSTHSLEWCLKGKKSTTVTCNKSGSVENSLRKSSQFRQLEDKNKLKELVVERNGRPIPPHFPCSLIKPGEKLIVKYVKAEEPKQPMSTLRSPTMSMNEIVEFNVVTKGGTNVKKIFKNPLLRSYKEVTVYGYKGEKVKRALERDGRFLNIVFEKNCALSELNTKVEFSNLVDDLGGKTFEIIMLNSDAPPESQPSSLDESVMTEDCSLCDEDENGNEGNLKQIKQEIHEIHEILGFKVFRSRLLCQVSDFMKRSTRQVSDLLCVEYGRSQGSFTASAMTKLMTSLKHSVCQVRIKGTGVGSGFLLFDTFVLTNYHVIKNGFDCSSNKLIEIVTVDFDFECLGHYSVEHQVQEVVAFEYRMDESGHKCDWALLSLTADPESLPAGLLPHCGVCQSGSICIIGHPHGNVKMVDLTWVIPVDHSQQSIERHYNENMKDREPVSVTVSGEVIQFVTSDFAKIVAKEVNNARDLSYETCFSFGASGSPVFDSHCNVVAMHSGGYVYEHSSGAIHSVIEYGHPLVSILENLMVQLMHRWRLDVLKKYLEVCCNHHNHIIDNVKKLVDSRNYTVQLQNAVNHQRVLILNDPTLKEFFQFICHTDPPVPMISTYS